MSAASVPVTRLRVRQGIVVVGGLLVVAAVFVVALRVLVVALGAVVYRLQEGRLLLLHHIGGGAAVGYQKNKS